MTKEQKVSMWVGRIVLFLSYLVTIGVFSGLSFLMIATEISHFFKNHNFTSLWITNVGLIISIGLGTLIFVLLFYIYPGKIINDKE